MGVLSSGDFFPEKIPTFGESNTGTIISSAVVVLGVPNDEWSNASERLGSYLARRQGAISGDSKTFKHSVFGGLIFGTVCLFASWTVNKFEFSESVGMSAFNWFLLGGLLGMLAFGWVDEVRKRRNASTER